MSAKKTTKKNKVTAKKKTTKKEAAKNPDDNRENKRIPIQLLVDYKANGHYLFDFCRDLGTGGIFIETKTPLDQGSPIDLTFTIPDSKETLNAKGQVIWVQKPIGEDKITAGMGVQFNGFTGEQRKMLEKFVERYHGKRFSAEEDKATTAAS